MFKALIILGLASYIRLSDAECSCPSKSLSVFVSGAKSLKVTAWSAELKEKYTIMVDAIAKIQVNANVNITILPNATLPNINDFVKVCTAQAISSQVSAMADKDLQTALQLVQSLVVSITATATDEQAMKARCQSGLTALVALVGQLVAKASASVNGLLSSVGGILTSSVASLANTIDALAKKAAGVAGNVSTVLSSVIAAKLKFDEDMVNLVLSLAKKVSAGLSPTLTKIANDLSKIIGSDCGPGVVKMIESLAADIKAMLSGASQADLSVIGGPLTDIVSVLNNILADANLKAVLEGTAKLSIGDLVNQLGDAVKFDAVIAIIAKIGGVVSSNAAPSCPSNSLSVFVSGAKSLKINGWSAELQEKYTIMINGIAKIQIAAAVSVTVLPNGTLSSIDDFVKVCVAQAISSQVSGMADKDLKAALQLVQSLVASITVTAADEQAMKARCQAALSALVDLVGQLLTKVSASVTGLLASAGGILSSATASLTNAVNGLLNNAAGVVGKVATLLSSVIIAKIKFDEALIELVMDLAKKVSVTLGPTLTKIANDLKKIIGADCGSGVVKMIESLSADIKAMLKSASKADLGVIGDTLNNIVAVLDNVLADANLKAVLEGSVKLSIGDIVKQLGDSAKFQAAIVAIAQIGGGVKV